MVFHRHPPYIQRMDASPDGRVTDEILEAVYADLRAIAATYLQRERVGHTLQPTALVHEAWVRLSDQHRATWHSAAHFRATSAMVMRRVLVDHAHRRNAAKRGGGTPALPLTTSIGNGITERTVDLLALNDALDRLATMDARQAQIVELRFFGGSTNEEIGAWLDINPRTVQREWRTARAWLFAEIEGSAEETD